MSKVKFKFDLGVMLRDKVSGVEGISTGRIEYLNGCIQYNIQPKAEADKPNKMPDAWRVDEPQLELVDAEPVKVTASPTGGPSTCEPAQKA